MSANKLVDTVAERLSELPGIKIRADAQGWRVSTPLLMCRGVSGRLTLQDGRVRVEFDPQPNHRARPGVAVLGSWFEVAGLLTFTAFVWICAVYSLAAPFLFGDAATKWFSRLAIASVAPLWTLAVWRCRMRPVEDEKQRLAKLVAECG